ncbi:Hypothetical protein CINCED_3A017472, partial [Cinara cedri]
KKIGDTEIISNLKNVDNFYCNGKNDCFTNFHTFIPIEDLDVARDSLADELPDKITPLLKWFEKPLLCRKTNSKKSGSSSLQFPPEIWNVYQRVLTYRNRANNYVEAANRHLNVQMFVTNLTIWSFGNLLKKYSLEEMFLNNWLLVEAHLKKKKGNIYIDNDKRTLKSNYDKNKIILFLKGHANNVSLG